MTITALSGCMARVPASRPPSPDALLGTYDLVSIGGRPLPVREFQAVYRAGRITLHPGQRYVSGIDAELCSAEGVCTRDAPTVEGVWLVLPDGTLEFHPREEEDPLDVYHDPAAEDVAPPRIEADGREIRFYTTASKEPYITYRRR